jgi:hypothetical protein
MSGTWPTARAAIVARLDGLTLALGGDSVAETLAAFEFAPSGRQGVINFPYAYVLPTARNVRRSAGMRYTTVDAAVRVFLAPPNAQTDAGALQRRYDAWCDEIAATFDGAVALGGAADVIVEQQFDGLERFDDIDQGWGFQFSLGSLRYSEPVTLTA